MVISPARLSRSLSSSVGPLPITKQRRPVRLPRNVASRPRLARPAAVALQARYTASAAADSAIARARDRALAARGRGSVTAFTHPHASVAAVSLSGVSAEPESAPAVGGVER